MPSGNHHPLIRGALVTGLGTFASRVAGLVRDMATAALFGLAAGGVMDAFVIAFRIPNLFRRLFGEGALTASYLPVFAQARQRDERSAWRLASTTMVWLGGVLAILILVGEFGLVLWYWASPDQSRSQLLAGLTAAMLPYVAFICLAALSAATLQALGRFAAPAYAPVLLNLCWIAGAVAIAPVLTSDPVRQAYILGACVLLGGLLQWAAQGLALRREGFRFQPDFAGSRDELRQIRLGMLPTALGLAATQLNTLLDSVVAWIFSAPAGGATTIRWLGDVPYPMQQGAAAAVYFGERLYQLPLGLVGIAVASVAFPRLATHAARGDRQAIADDLTLSLRLVLLLSIPCAVGLVVLAEPITRLLFERGQFTSEDAARTARMIAVYGSAVWAYCASAVLVRGFYATGDRTTPLRLAVAVVVLNCALNLILIWPLAESGLAAATALAAVAQTIGLAILFHKRLALDWRLLRATTARTGVASALMAAACLAVLHLLPDGPGLWVSLVRVTVPIIASAAIFALALGIFSRPDWRDLFARR